MSDKRKNKNKGLRKQNKNQKETREMAQQVKKHVGDDPSMTPSMNTRAQSCQEPHGREN